MLTLQENQLVFSFPEVHPDANCSISFQRTLRLPDDDNWYRLPSGLGEFPLLHTEDYAESTPPHWQNFGGVMLPVCKSEAMRINFTSSNRYPFAIKVAAGKINAITGESWKNELQESPRDYLAIPEQCWLDGYQVSKDMARQFVAMPLGQGDSVEEQTSGKAEFGGIQIIVYPMKAERYQQKIAEETKRKAANADLRFSLARPEMSFSLGAGSKQKVSIDPYGLAAYEEKHSSRCFIQLVNCDHWQKITGELPPFNPFTAKDYKKEGLPWFDYYSDAAVFPAASVLSRLKGLASNWLSRGDSKIKNNKSPRH